MELDPRNVLLWIIAIANIALGLLIGLKDRKNIVNRSFGNFAISIAFWSFVLIAFRNFDQEEIALFTIKLSYFAAVFIAASFWDFSVAFTSQKLLSGIKRSLLWGGAFLMGFLLMVPSFLTRSIVYNPWGKSVMLGIPDYFLFTIYFLFFFFGGLLIIGKRLRCSTGFERLQLKFIFWSVLLAGSGGVAFNLFMPSPFWDEWRFIWIGPIFTFLIVLFITYAIAKHRLLNIKAIAAELLTVALIVGLAIELFLSPNLIAALFRLIILVFVTVSGVLLVRSVINEVKRREEMERLKNELEVAYAKLQEVDQAKTDFLSMASHQLRSPLTVVRLGLGALMDGTFGKLADVRQKGAMEKMLESTNRLIRLIGDYLNVSRIELGKMKYDFKKQDLCVLLRDIVEEYVPKAKAKGLQLKFETGNLKLETGGAKGVRLKFETGNLKLSSRGGPALGGETKGLKVVFDEEKLRHVIMNLIDNAIKYTLKGKIEVKCELETGNSKLETESWAKVSVKDTGMGLTPADIAVLFEKFRRASSAHQRRREGEPIEGSGLGLHVAKMFVDKHGGKIWAESPGKGKGSTFYFALPVSGPPELPPEELGEGGKSVELPI